MRLGAIFQSALTAGPGAYSRGVTTRLNEDALRIKAEQDQAALADMRLQRDEAARLRGVVDKTATTEQIGQLPMFDVTGQKSFVPIDVPEAAPTAGLSTAPKYTPMGPATGVQQQVAEKIKAEALRQGLEPDIALRIAAIESTMGTNVANPESSARGVFQFLTGKGSAWVAMGGGDPLDTDLNIKRGVKLTMENHRGLTKALGRQPTGAELYLALQQGLGGAKALLLNPTMRAVDALQKTGMTAKQATDHLEKNRINTNMTAAQVNALFYNKYNAAGGGVRQFLSMPAVVAGVTVPTSDQMKAAFGKPGQVYMPAASAKAVPTSAAMQATFGKAAAKAPVPAAGVQPPAAAPTAESSLVAEVAAQPAGTVDATKWKQILLDTPGKPGRELAAFMDKRAGLVRLAENFREARLSGKYLETVAAIKELDGTAAYLHGMQALQNFADGDPRYLQAVLSESMQRQVEIQPRSDGKFDLYSYEGGKRVLDETGLTPAGLEAMARTRFDTEYNERMAKIADEYRASAIKKDEEGYKSSLKINEIAAESRRDIYKLMAEGKNEEAAERLKSELGGYSDVTVDTATSTLIVRRGQQFTRIGTSTVKGPDGKDMQTLVSQDISGNVGGWNSSLNIPISTGR